MSKKFLKYSVSVIIILFSYGFIYHKLSNHETLKNFTLNGLSISRDQGILIIFVFLAMMLNWSLEALKWKELVKKITSIQFLRSLQMILTSVTVGIFTPNRIGELAGRAYFLKKGKRTYGLLAAGIGSLAQLTVTVVMGLTGFILFLLFFPDKIHINSLFNKFTALLIVILAIFLGWSLFHVQKIKPLLLKIPLLRKKSEQIEFLSHQSKKSIFIILMLSFVRYLVFSAQFYLLLIICNVHIQLLEGVVAITLTYFFTSIVPTTTLAELGIRGSLAIFLVGIFTSNIPGIILATLVIWVINLGLPALAGAPFLLFPPK
ncbi:MAG: lysylphosphatidylglycerol synthase domain-containing protein [Bacteroidales bacterium]|jgi:uncharacterized membrane protein YwzB|nr:lysylphosphatidylglycerol synthase domain-containing protein [Bacteroidales bacterium]